MRAFAMIVVAMLAAAGQSLAYAHHSFAAFDRSNEERIWPAVQDLPGLVGVLVGSTSDGGRVTLTLAESIETLEAGAAAILSTDLLPWEKPEHLTGPDGLAALRLLHADVPAAAPSA